MGYLSSINEKGLLILSVVLLTSCQPEGTASELWGRMSISAQDKLTSEINKSFIALHPGCRRSEIHIDSYPESLVITAKCADGKDKDNDINTEQIKYSEEVK